MEATGRGESGGEQSDIFLTFEKINGVEWFFKQ